MIATQLATYLALNKIDGIGVKFFQRIEAAYPDITALLRCTEPELMALGFKEKQLQQWRNIPWNVIEKELKWAEQSHCHILQWHDPAYPRLLREIHRPPVILYVKGELDALNRMTLAIVGTRHPTPYGKNNAQQFAQQLGSIGFCIASGLAIGIDGIAHHSVLSSPAGTIAVVATGLDQVYPERHKNLAEKIIGNGAIISEFPFNTPPRQENFPRRNRIISGLSRGVLVIEAAVKSGSLITARYAMEQGREVFAIPGMIHNPHTQGCHALIRQGAVLVHHVDDILEELGMNPPTKKPAEKKPTPPAEPGSLLSYLDYGIPTSIDKLIEQSRLSTAEIMSQLLILELAGQIQRMPNGGYCR